MAPRTVRRVLACALVPAADGAPVLLDAGGPASLPVAVVEHGEHPREAAARALLAAGVPGEVGDVVAAVSDTVTGDDVVVHSVTVAFGARPGTGVATRGLARPGARPTALTARLLGRPDGEPVVHPPLAQRRSATPAEVQAAADEPEPVAVPPVQRPAAYACVVDDGRVLLTRLSGGEGLWTLPGGGIDPGEQPVDALVREVHEECGLPIVPGRLLGVDSRRFTGHAPGGRLEDFHGIRLIWSGTVPTDVAPRVVEVGGSTDAAAWVPTDRLATTPLTSLAAGALAAFG